jgi:hypothetical protein
MKTIVFTLCSNNYLAQAKTLGDSITATNPTYEFVIGLVDKLHPQIDYTFFSPHKILRFDEIGCPEFDEMIKKYNIVEFNTAVKPFYIDYFFNRYPNCIIYYIDPDIEVFRSLSHLEEIFNAGNDFILTPHLVMQKLERSRFEPLILNVGIYNLGFLGIRNSEKARSFIKWWRDRLTDFCLIDFPKGLFVDQIWINFLPAFYDNVFTLRDPGYNVGYWNFSERYLTPKGDSFVVNNEYNLQFFHFSTYDPLQPERLGKHLGYSFEKRPDLVVLYQEYARKLLANKYAEFSAVSRLLQFRENHPYADKKTKSTKARVIRLVKKCINALR